MRLAICGECSLIEPRKQERSAGGLAKTAHIAAVVFNRSSRAGKGGFTGRDFLTSELDRRPTRHSDCARWNISTTVRNFEAESICDLITPSLMYLDERRLLSLVSNWAARTDAGPIEDAEIVEAAFGCQHGAAFHRSFSWDLRSPGDERSASLLLAKVSHSADTHQLMLRDRVNQIQVVRIAGVAIDLNFYRCIEISMIDVGGRDSV